MLVNFIRIKNSPDIIYLIIFQLIRLDKSIVEGLQDIVLVLEDQLRPLVQAELSLLVDILYRPELLFPTVAAAAAIGDTASVAVAAATCGVTGFINRYYKLFRNII